MKSSQTLIGALIKITVKAKLIKILHSNLKIDSVTKKCIFIFLVYFFKIKMYVVGKIKFIFNTGVPNILNNSHLEC